MPLPRSLALAALLASAPLAAGCGGAERPTPASTPAERPAPAAELPSPPRPWAEMDRDARKRWMATAVMDAMAPRFQAWRPEEYARFGCASCHGERAAEGDFSMPNPALPALYPTGHPEQHRMVREHPEAVRFMFNQVTKPMMKLLGQPEYDPETGRGFGCFSCHPAAEAQRPPAAEAP